MKLAKLITVPAVAAVASKAAMAHCPLCTVATGAAVAVVRFYGIHDGIVGILVGGFAVSTGLWMHNILKKRGITFPFQGSSMTLASILLTIITLQMAKVFHEAGTVFGIPYLLAGLLVGSTASGIAFIGHERLRHYYGRNLVPLQGMAAILLGLLISVIAVGAAL